MAGASFVADDEAAQPTILLSSQAQAERVGVGLFFERFGEFP